MKRYLKSITIKNNISNKKITIKSGEYYQLDTSIVQIRHIGKGKAYIAVKKLVKLPDMQGWLDDAIPTYKFSYLKVSKISKLKRVLLGLDNIKDIVDLLRTQ